MSARVQFADDPFRLLRFIVGALLLGGTVAALLMAVTGVAPRALLLAGGLWALYGLFMGVVGGILEPVIEGGARLFSNVGLVRAGGGFSQMEALVVRGRYHEAAEAYLGRIRTGANPIEATLRRAALLAGPLEAPLMAAGELEDLRRQAEDLPPGEDVRVGLALVDIYDYRLQDPGKAMAEMRRLIDRHPESRHVRRMRQQLRRLKADHFGAEFDSVDADPTGRRDASA
jgi:hypothetical protein